MDLENIRRKVKEKLNDEKRFKHSEEVAKKAVEIVKMHNLDVNPNDAYLAGLIHDYAKFEDKEKYQEVVVKNDLNFDILDEPFNLLHAFLGIYIIKDELAIRDPKILEAIYFHPVGSGQMNTLSEVLFLADFIEDSRNYEACIETRIIANRNFKKAIANKLKFLIENDYNHPLTTDAYKKYSKYLKE